MEPEPLHISSSQTRTLCLAHITLFDYIFLRRKSHIPVLKGYYITHSLQWNMISVWFSSVPFSWPSLTHLKNQCRVGRYLWGAPSWAIGVFWFARNPTDFTNLHSCHSNIPCFDHLTYLSQISITWLLCIHARHMISYETKHHWF